jgi:deoxyribodipyrimidine photo-lyase
LTHQEFQNKFRNKINRNKDKEAVKIFLSWIKGETGYKVVDAAMMQLAKTGWMHNRSLVLIGDGGKSILERCS